MTTSRRKSFVQYNPLKSITHAEETIIRRRKKKIFECWIKALEFLDAVSEVTMPLNVHHSHKNLTTTEGIPITPWSSNDYVCNQDSMLEFKDLVDDGDDIESMSMVSTVSSVTDLTHYPDGQTLKYHLNSVSTEQSIKRAKVSSPPGRFVSESYNLWGQSMIDVSPMPIPREPPSLLPEKYPILPAGLQSHIILPTSTSVVSTPKAEILALLSANSPNYRYVGELEDERRIDDTWLVRSFRRFRRTVDKCQYRRSQDKVADGHHRSTLLRVALNAFLEYITNRFRVQTYVEIRNNAPKRQVIRRLRMLVELKREQISKLSLGLKFYVVNRVTSVFRRWHYIAISRSRDRVTGTQRTLYLSRQGRIASNTIAEMKRPPPPPVRRRQSLLIKKDWLEKDASTNISSSQSTTKPNLVERRHLSSTAQTIFQPIAHVSTKEIVNSLFHCCWQRWHSTWVRWSNAIVKQQINQQVAIRNYRHCKLHLCVQRLRAILAFKIHVQSHLERHKSLRIENQTELHKKLMTLVNSNLERKFSVHILVNQALCGFGRWRHVVKGSRESISKSRKANRFCRRCALKRGLKSLKKFILTQSPKQMNPGPDTPGWSVPTYRRSDNSPAWSSFAVSSPSTIEEDFDWDSEVDVHRSETNSTIMSQNIRTSINPSEESNVLNANPTVAKTVSQSRLSLSELGDHVYAGQCCTTADEKQVANFGFNRWRERTLRSYWKQFMTMNIVGAITEELHSLAFKFHRRKNIGRAIRTWREKVHAGRKHDKRVFCHDGPLSRKSQTCSSNGECNNRPPRPTLLPSVDAANSVDRGPPESRFDLL